jgi:hypothetical protein
MARGDSPDDGGDAAEGRHLGNIFLKVYDPLVLTRIEVIAVFL